MAHRLFLQRRAPRPPAGAAPLLLAATFLLAAAAPALAFHGAPPPPAFLFDRGLPLPEARVCLPPLMVQDPLAVHTWWARAAGGRPVDITLVAFAVNPAETGVLRARIYDPGGAQVALRNVTYPAAGEAEASPFSTVPAGAGSLWRIEVHLQTPLPAPPAMPARHYRLEVQGASLLGTRTPLAAQAEHDDATWGVNVGFFEPPSTAFVSPGPEAGAVAGNVSLTMPSGLPAGTAPVGGALPLAGPAGMWGLAVRGLDGHYVAAKAGGVDIGLYAHWTTWGFGTLAGNLTRGGFPNTLPVSIVIEDVVTGATVRTLANVTGAYLADKMPVGDYFVRVVAADAPPAQRRAVTCEGNAFADFAFRDAPPVAHAGSDIVQGEGTMVALSSAGSLDPDGTPLSYLWTVATLAGPPVVLADPAAPNPSFFAPDDARYAFTLTVASGGVSASDMVNVTILNRAPTASAGPDVAGLWGFPLAFDGSAGDPGPLDVAAPLGIHWDLGDGAGSGALDPAHAYAAPGVYTARLTVTDKDGASANDTALATVARRPTTLTYTGDTSGVAGVPATLSAVLRDGATGLPVAGAVVAFDVAGLHVTAVTDATGTATVAGLMLPAGSHVVASSFAGDARYLPSADADALVVVSGEGHVTGGVLRGRHGGTGGFNVRAEDGVARGQLQYVGHDGIRYHARDMTFLAVSPDRRTATFAGASADGVPFVAYVEDNGEPGRDDVFRLAIAGTVVTDGLLTGGNIQIHR